MRSSGKLPLKQAADLHFNKTAGRSPLTIASESRIFRRVDKYFGDGTKAERQR